MRKKNEDIFEKRVKKEPLKSKRRNLKHESSVYFNRLAELEARKGEIQGKSLYIRKGKEKKKTEMKKKPNFILNRKSVENTPLAKGGGFSNWDQLRSHRSEPDLRKNREVSEFFSLLF